MDFYKDFYKAFYGEVSLTETIDEKLEDVGSSIVDVGVSLSKIVLNSYLNKEIGINIKKTLEELNLEKLKGEKYFLLEDYFSHIKNLDELKDSFLNEEGKKVIIIDELDRCRPDYAIYLLEEIKHIFDIKNVVFIFLINKRQLSNIVSNMYMSCDINDEYFEKFYDVELNLPYVDYEELKEKEFKKYDILETYSSITDKNEKRNLVIEKIFIDMAVKNDSTFIDSIAPRKFKKLLKKFRVLIQSLSESEKSQHFLILVISAYFLIKECEYVNSTESEIKKIQTIISKYLYKENTDYDNTIINALKTSKFALKNENYSQRMTKKTSDIVLVEYKENIKGTVLSFENFFNSVTVYTWGSSPIRYVYVEIKENDILEWCENKYNFIQGI